jgi:hypothetical protein
MKRSKRMNDDKKLVKIQDDDLVIVELDTRYDMSIIDPLGVVAVQPVVINQAGCNNCVAGC